MFNNPKIFTKISKLTQTVELANRSTILSAGNRTVRIKPSHCFLDLSDCLLVENLLYNLISLGQILKPNYKLLSYENKDLQVCDQNKNLIVKRSFKCGNFKVNIKNELSLTTVSCPKNPLTPHQAARHPSPEYLNKMFPKIQCPKHLMQLFQLLQNNQIPVQGILSSTSTKTSFPTYGPIWTC
ncbi:hypothetical protein O181_018216 [Austropuccinia psidii MF-1]|uniref:Uncharacterized protein n=1 Tax=Austropuccinia psidii MF-1 TaxID=1389203 RepID=A0A9Q3C4V6_9BASI|nr:hypothetical protein [Austropuccinia psidii MF-1]